MRKDFTGILLLSDYDGTLYNGKIPERNIEALKYFMAHGGMFSLATGRGCEFIVKNNELPIMPNVPMVGLTGSQIYDLSKRECIWKSQIPVNMAKHIAKIMQISDAYQTELAFDGHFYMAKKADEIEGATTSPIYKAVVFSKQSTYENPVPENVVEYAKGKFNICSNCPELIEVTAFGTNKGTAVRKLKEITGAKTLICVGDFNGDNPMLIEADIGYAVRNALEQTKAVADKVTLADVDEGAIAEIIENL